MNTMFMLFGSKIDTDMVMRADMAGSHESITMVENGDLDAPSCVFH